MTDYHDPYSCNKCGKDNEVTVTASDGSSMYEGKTKCNECGHEDYWAYGWFESGAEMVSKCSTYNFQ